MVVAITVNTVPRGEFFVVRTPQGDYLVRSDDLRALGLAAARGTTVTHDGEPHVSLRSIAGLAFALEEATLVLRLTVEPRLLQATVLDLGSRRRVAPVDASQPSAFLNYAFDVSDSTGHREPQLSFTGEAGARWSELLFTTNFNTLQADGGRRLVRLMSTVTRDDVAAMRQWVAGDFFASSWEMGTGATLGGIGVSRRFSLDPYLIRYPTYTLTGSAPLPSEVELYVDGQRVRTERVQPGSFELRELTGYGGARDVYLLVRDPFGRVERIDYPLYFSDQPLQQGLHDYSYGLGAIRRNLGHRSNDYGPPAFAFYHRYGVTDALTLGVRGEGSRELRNGGVMATVVLGQAGVLGLAASASAVDGIDGHAAAATYSYQARDIGASLYVRHNSRRYVTLGSPLQVSGRRWDLGANATFSLGAAGWFSLAHSVQRGHTGDAFALPAPGQPFTVNVVGDRRDTVLSYGVPLPTGRASVTATLNHIKDRTGSRNEFHVRMSLALDPSHRVQASYQWLQDARITNLQYSQSQPVGEGLGYELQGTHADLHEGHQLQLATTLQYNAPAAIVRASYGLHRTTVGQASTDRRWHAGVAGSVALLAGELALARPINDAFGLVRTGELADVPVTVNGQPMGRTDARGMLFVPRLTPYTDNQVAIAPENLPLDYAIGTTRKRVAPAARGGVVVDFDVSRVQGFSGKVVLAVDGAAGAPMEYGEITLSSPSFRVVLPTGRAGEFYVENLAPGAYDFTVRTPGQGCRGNLQVPVSQEPFVLLGEVRCSRE